MQPGRTIRCAIYTRKSGYAQPETPKQSPSHSKSRLCRGYLPDIG